MTKKIPASSSGISTIDGLLEELQPYLWVDRYSPAQTRMDALEFTGTVRLEEAPSDPATNAEVWRMLFERTEEIIALVGDRLVQAPELTIKGTTRDRHHWRSLAEITLTVHYEP